MGWGLALQYSSSEKGHDGELVAFACLPDVIAHCDSAEHLQDGHHFCGFAHNCLAGLQDLTQMVHCSGGMKYSRVASTDCLVLLAILFSTSSRVFIQQTLVLQLFL